MKSGIGLVLLLPIVLMCAACYTLVTPIGDIWDNPSDYRDRLVDIEGTVTHLLDAPILNALEIPSLPTAVFEIKDHTAAIVVVTDRPAPALGKHVRVRGRVNALFILDTWSPGLHLKEHSRRATRESL